MNGAGFDWLNIASLKSDSALPPPPVSFGVTPNSSTSSLNLVKDNHTSLQQLNRPISENGNFKETQDDLSVPLSLSANQLTREEAKTYLRWYNDIVVRKGTKLIRLHDVFNFLNNFKITTHAQKALEHIFKDCVSLNIGEFFSLLRLISHSVIKGEDPRRSLVLVPAPTLKPRSILSTKRKETTDDDNDNEQLNKEQLQLLDQFTGKGPKKNDKLDLDSFTQFILTGERPDEVPKKKLSAKSKRVKFSDEVSVEPTEVKEVEPVKIDLSLPMDQLLNSLPKKSGQSQNQHINEEEELKEMQDSFNHFQNVKNVDSALIHGVPANIPSVFFDEAGNASPAGISSPDPSARGHLLSPNHTGPVPGLLSPSHTGPVPFANSLLNSFNTPHQTHQNQFLSPNLTGQYTQAPLPLAPSMTGSLSNSMRHNSNAADYVSDTRFNSVSPALSSSASTPPVPPQRRSRSVSSPIPYNQLPTHSTVQDNRATSPLAPRPPPSRRSRGASTSGPPPPAPPSRNGHVGPPLPPKFTFNNDSNEISNPNQYSVYDRVLQDFTSNGQPIPPYHPYAQQNNSNEGSNSSSTADILGDLKALQTEVDRLQSLQR